MALRSHLFLGHWSPRSLDHHISITRFSTRFSGHQSHQTHHHHGLGTRVTSTRVTQPPATQHLGHPAPGVLDHGTIEPPKCQLNHPSPAPIFLGHPSTQCPAPGFSDHQSHPAPGSQGSRVPKHPGQFNYPKCLFISLHLLHVHYP